MKKIDDITKGRVQGYIMAVAVHIQQHGMSTYARNLFEDLGIKWNALRRTYQCDEGDMEVLQKHKHELTKRQRTTH